MSDDPVIIDEAHTERAQPVFDVLNQGAKKRDVSISDTMSYGERSWEFNAAVTDVFDEMLERSIPQYEVMRQAVFDVGARFVVRGSDVVDLGSSRGEAIAPLLKRFGATVSYVCVEMSEPMVLAFQQRYVDWLRQGIIRLHRSDLRTDFPFASASLVQSVLTLMFTPINYRQRIIQKCHDVLLDGGAFILVEKVLGEGAQVDELQVELYHAMKAANGYTREEIDRKRLALEGVQVPLTSSANEAMLRNAGFRQVDVFWRWMNFAAWVAIK